MTEAEIAARLTKAQRAVVCKARHIAHRNAYLPDGFYVDGDRRVLRNLAFLGIIRDYLGPQQRLTHFGLSIRAELMKEKDRGE